LSQSPPGDRITREKERDTVGSKLPGLSRDLDYWGLDYKGQPYRT
jgi:hypothetical protein